MGNTYTKGIKIYFFAFFLFPCSLHCENPPTHPPILITKDEKAKVGTNP